MNYIKYSILNDGVSYSLSNDFNKDYWSITRREQLPRHTEELRPCPHPTLHTELPSLTNRSQ